MSFIALNRDWFQVNTTNKSHLEKEFFKNNLAKEESSFVVKNTHVARLGAGS